jgi:hypothetical protein
MSSSDFAAKTGLNERYLREWLSAQAASKYVSYDSTTNNFSMTPEQAFVFANPGSPFYLAPAFGAAAAFQQNMPMVEKAFETGDGVAWGEQTQCLSCSVARFFRPGYENHLVQAWLPSIDGVVETLQQGGEVADVGCGHGVSTLIMAQAFPPAKVNGFDSTRSPLKNRGSTRASTTLRTSPSTFKKRRNCLESTTSSRCSTACTTWAIP